MLVACSWNKRVAQFCTPAFFGEEIAPESLQSGLALAAVHGFNHYLLERGGFIRDVMRYLNSELSNHNCLTLPALSPHPSGSRSCLPNPARLRRVNEFGTKCRIHRQLACWGTFVIKLISDQRI